MSQLSNFIIFANILLAISSNVAAKNDCVIKEFDQVDETLKRCTNIVVDSLVVPGGQQLLLRLTEGSTLAFRGTTKFGFAEWKGNLVVITGSNITVYGEKDSLLDGQGPLWWDGQGTWGNLTKPKFFRIKNTNNSIFYDINIKNCPVGCTQIEQSENVTLRNFKIDISEGDEGVAPENKFGHNTDGFGISKSQNILIEDAVVYNQDDCVVVNSGKHITARNLFCHGSHGLSISVKGSVVEDVLFENCTVTNSENGIHVKTRTDAGDGLIKNIVYKDITLLDCTMFGISVQQNYQDLPHGQPQDGPPENNIPIVNLELSNVRGNVLDVAVPVFVLCAEEGCFDWKWEGVNMKGALSNNCTGFTPVGYNC
ncbi:unnamed protein product [Ceutorhynchus assimilis]|uniref:endo-polygalacturonase n=1 Tax=Ceutorhynchus assimilis TaxID=467358 RepID=A0A9N9MZ96_9CUCU|nr:unnamed protein product [Ceutorhynchus assimilis]